VGSFQWCIPDPNDPNGQICEDIPVVIDPPKMIPDPKNLLGPITEQVRTDIALLVGVDQLAASVQDDQLRAYLVGTVDEMALRLGSRLPAGTVLKRVG
jgi:hypothetical protein